MEKYHPGLSHGLSYEAYCLYCAIMGAARWWPGETVYAYRAHDRLRVDPAYSAAGRNNLDPEQLRQAQQELVDKRFILLGSDQYGAPMYYTGNRNDLEG